MTLLYLYAFLIVLVIIMVHRHYWWIWLLILILPWQLARLLMKEWMRHLREEACRWDPDGFNEVISKVCGTFRNRAVTRSSRRYQRICQYPILFWKSLELTSWATWKTFFMHGTGVLVLLVCNLREEENPCCSIMYVQIHYIIYKYNTYTYILCMCLHQVLFHQT